MLLLQTIDQALAGVVLPSGAGTLTIGPQAMEGNLQIHPGDTIKAGYDFTMPGAHAAAQVTVDNASVTVGVTCSNGATPPPITFALPVQTYSDPAGSPSWYPSGDQASAAVYQGSVTAPDLCSGGIMSGAKGATFNATIFSTDTTDKINFRFHYSDNTSGSWSATKTASPTPTAKTVLTATLTPSLGLTLAVDHSTAIPGDTLTYSGTVTNSGATLRLTGDFSASASSGSTATVKSYWDNIATSPDSTNWTALAGAAAAQSGYTPAVAPPISSGMTLTATPVAVSGVTYPTSGDLLLGTTIAPGSSALWHYSASVPLTPSQVATLLDPTKVKAIRNSFHLEVSPANPNITQPSIINVDFSGIFFGASPKPSGAVTNIVVAVQPPSGSAIQITAAQISGLASLAPGASASYSTTYQVPAVAAKGTTETDAAYVARLKAIEGTTLTASASASGSSTGGSVTTSAPAVSTTEHLPIVSISKSGPATVPAGTTGTYPLALQNTGGAPASGMAITDSVPSGTTGAVSGIPTTLAPAASSSGTQATFLVPVNQSAGSLTDTASLTWQDANGNTYGSISSMFTTQVQAANKLTITGGGGPNPTGASEAVTATLVDLNGQPVGNQSVFLSVTGPNSQQSTVTTDPSGVATFSYLGANAGTDTLQASTSNGVQSNTLSVTWFTPIQKVSSTAVQGNFYAEPSNPQGFVVTPQSVPDFGQSFPTIDFNPPAGTIPHSPAVAPTDQTRPFTDVTTDVNGNYNGTIVAQGNNLQAGVGNLLNFDAVFTASFIVAQPGDVTFSLHVDDGFLFGVGNNATRVSGANENPPASNVSAIQGYPLVGAVNLTGASGNYTVTVHFPNPGTYPYELDYFEANAGQLSLTMSVASFTAQTNPLSIYVGYADGLRPAGSIFPFPWLGSPNVNFIGCCPAFDAGAIRFDNSSSNAITLDSVTVDIGGNHFDLWGRNLTVPANQILILSQTGQFNFDTSDFSGCGANNGVIPKVNVTQAGVTTSFNDTNQILNTFGFDLACHGNESQSWQRIGGGGTTINVPLPPATTLALTPATVTGIMVGQTQTFTVSAMDATGQPVANLPVTLAIAGTNGSGVLNGTSQINSTTNSAGLARFSYVGLNTGTDTAQVTASVMGLRSLSNTGSVTWVLSPTGGGGTAPAPAITNPSPADGTTVTMPVPITATFAPPAGQTISSWSVTYQALPQGPVVTLASGAGTPANPLATFDPTRLANGMYAITISATASGGGIQTATSTVSVYGNLKPGRYTATYQDLSVPVDGFQMAVRRTYDSIDKSSGDFGVGWKVAVANFRVSANHVLGLGGWTQYNSSCALGLCFTAFRNSAPRFVTVTFPDQHTEFFDFTPTGGTNVFLGGGAAFTARAGTTSTLAAGGDPSLTYTFDGNLYGGNGPYNPQRFTLTTKDGRVLILDTQTGLVSETDTFGNSLSVSAGGVNSTQGPASSPTAGPSINFTRDGQGRITDINGPLGTQHVHYDYSASINELHAVTDPSGNVDTYAYDPSTGNLSSVTGPGNAPLSAQTYDANGRLQSVSTNGGPAVTINTDPGLLQQTFNDPNGKLTTVLTYDNLGDVVQKDDVVSGQPSLTSKYQYDPLGRVTDSIDPAGNETKLQYDETATAANGNVLSASQVNLNRTWRYQSYNAIGEPGQIVRPDGTVLMTLSYDSNTGAILSTQATGQPAATFSYSPSGQLNQQVDAGGRQLNYSYDSNGHVASIGDGTNPPMQVSMDSGGLLRSVTNAVGNQIKYDYWPTGQLKTETNGRNSSWQSFYDALGRLDHVTDPLLATTQYHYNALGQLDQITDRNLAVTTYSYDVDGNLVRQTRPGNDVVNFGYDALGHLTEADSAASHVDRSYDLASRLQSETSCANTGASATQCPAPGTTLGGLPVVKISYQYWPDGQVKQVTSSDTNTAVNYAYDTNGRVQTISDPASPNASYTYGYDAAGRVGTLQLPNGIINKLSYSVSGDLTGIDASLNSAPVAGFDYQVDPVTGRRTQLTDAAGQHGSTYYATGTLASETHPSGSGLSNQTYTYDAAGNRSAGSVTSQFDAADRLQSDGSYTYAFDAEGNLKTKTPVGGGAGTTYAWNSDHQLTSITYPNGTSSSYQYDAFGRRLKSQDPSGTTAYVYDGLAVHADYDGQGHLQTSYLPQLEAVSGTSRSYYLTDGQGTVRNSTDSSGSITGRSAYSAWGIPASGNTTGNRYTLTGYQYDQASGLYYAGSRYYDPTTGRFLSEDPQPAANSYPYAANDPVNNIDVRGEGPLVEYAMFTLNALNNAECVAGVASAITTSAFSATMSALAGAQVTADQVTAAIAVGVGLSVASCAANAATAGGGKGIQANRLVGRALEKKVIGELEKLGFARVAEQYWVRTGLGWRVIDYLAIRNGHYVAFEIKAGGSVYLASQIAKDTWMARLGVDLFRDGQIYQIPTVLIRG